MKSVGAAILLAAVCEVACSSSKPTAVIDDVPDSGGQVDDAGSGGTPEASAGTGGATASGGATAATGGARGTGGAIGTGGGAAGGSTGTGGAGATGGSGAGGNDGGAVDAPAQIGDSAAQDMRSTGAGGMTGDAGSTGAGAWPAVSDYAAPGPFTTTREMNIGPAGAYDLFRPTALGAEHRKHPIISWANGTLYSVDDYAPLLTHWASHGFVVIANHTNTTAGGGTHKAGIDWLVSQNAAATSPYFGMLDVTKIGASGHSQGGGATIAAGASKPGTTGITVTLPLMALLQFETDKTIVAHQLVPMFNIYATMDQHDLTGMIANQIYDGAVTELVQAAFIGVHEDAMGPKMHAPTVAWFRWKLMDDTQAKAFFYPMSACGLCLDAAWKTVRYKNPSP